MNKREFIKTSLFCGVGLIGLPAVSKGVTFSGRKGYVVPVLPSSENIINNFISHERLVEHHATCARAAQYLNNYFYNDTAELPQARDIIRNAGAFNAEIRNQATKYLNHKLFLKLLHPVPYETADMSFRKAVERNFGTPQDLQHQFENLALNKKSNGWIWLLYNNNLSISFTKPGNSPFSYTLASEQRGYPLLGLDLNGINPDGDVVENSTSYISGFWSSIDWNFVSKRYLRAVGSEI